MKYRENLSIILMRDNGPRRSYRVRRGRFVAALGVMACLPVACAVLGWLCWTLWQQNVQLRDNVLRFESDSQTARPGVSPARTGHLLALPLLPSERQGNRVFCRFVSLDSGLRLVKQFAPFYGEVS